MSRQEDRPPRIKPSTLECFAILLDRRRRPAINFIECGSSGFGDRLRGIAYALFLAKKHGASKIYYSQALDEHGAPNDQDFPFKMTDLISIQGMEFVPFAIPIELRTATYIHYSQAGNPLKRYGFPEMWRVEPKQPGVIRRLKVISEGGPFLGLHVRKTDTEFRSRGPDTHDEEVLKSVNDKASNAGIKRVYVAADNADSFGEWRDRLTRSGLDVIDSHTTFDPGTFRQTGAEDTMVDFFALSRSQVLVRSVPSEFSRFAGWIGKKRLRYADLK